MAVTLPGIPLDLYEFPAVESVRLRNGQRWSIHNHLITEARELPAAFERLGQADEGSYDCEGSGLHPELGARICGHALAVRDVSAKRYDAFYLPVRHVTEDPQLDAEAVAPFLRELFARWQRVLGHHLKFDAMMLRYDGVELAPRWIDTALEAVIHDENELRFGLKPLTDKYALAGASTMADRLEEWLRRDARQLKLRYEDRKRGEDGELGEPTYLERYGYSRAPITLCAHYGCHDAVYPHALHDRFAPEVWPAYAELYERELEVAHELLEMQYWGLPVDVNEILRADREMRREVQHWRDELARIAGEPVEIDGNSLRRLFYEKLALVPMKETASGLGSADKESRSLLAKRYPEHAPLMRAIDRLSVAEKIRSTYAGSWLRYVSPGGRVHSSYNQLEGRDEEGIPKTGRLASSDPNSQNVAKKPVHLYDCGCDKCQKAGNAPGPTITVSVRRYYTVPRGFVRLFIDLSQIEIRMLAWLTQDPVLLDCFARGLDVHQLTADACTGGNRDLGKIVGLGIQYGMGAIGMAKRLPNYTDEPEQAQADAADYIANYMRTYVRYLPYRNELARYMQANDCMFVSPFGRPRRIEAIRSQDKGEFASALRKMMSSMVSGSSADLLKEIIRRCRRVLDRTYGQLPYRERGRLVQTIHDENVFDLPIQGCAPVIHELHRCHTYWPQIEAGGVQILASAALSTTTWEDKREITLLPDGGFQWK